MTDKRSPSPYVRLTTKFSYANTMTSASKASGGGNWKKKEKAVVGVEQSVPKRTLNETSVNKKTIPGDFKGANKLKSLSPQLYTVISNGKSPTKKSTPFSNGGTTRKSSTSTNNPL